MYSSGKTVTRLRSRMSGLSSDIGWLLGSYRSYFSKARGARILLYHGLCKGDPLRYNTLFVNHKTFESQLRLYKEYFNLVSLDDLYAQRFSDDRFDICLSFDDGFSNNYRYVLPLLEKYQVPAVFFITAIRNEGYDVLWNDALSIAYKNGPEKIGFDDELFVKGRDSRYKSAQSGKKLAEVIRGYGFEKKAAMLKLLNQFLARADKDYWMQMTTEEINLLSSSRWVTIGSHGYYHNDLAVIAGDALKEELVRSKQFLENVTGKEIKALAFPYGSYSDTVINEATAAGYTQLLTTAYQLPEDAANPLLKERLTINPFISNINQLHATISGNYK